MPLEEEATGASSNVTRICWYPCAITEAISGPLVRSAVKLHEPGAADGSELVTATVTSCSFPQIASGSITKRSEPRPPETLVTALLAPANGAVNAPAV